LPALSLAVKTGGGARQYAGLAKRRPTPYICCMKVSRPMFFVSCLSNVLLGSLLLRRAR
jgi:hypothetical protein